MRNLLLVGAVGLSLIAWLAGCGQDKPKEPAKVGDNPLNAPSDYLGAVAKAKKHADKSLDMVQLKRSIEQFYASEDRYPKDLQELVQLKYLPQVPPAPPGMTLVYEAKSGVVKLTPQGAPPQK